MAEPDLGIIRYSIRSVDFEGTLNYIIYIDGDVRNEDTNYGKKFWTEVNREVNEDYGILTTRTLKTDFHVATGMSFEFQRDKNRIDLKPDVISREKYVANVISTGIKPGEELVLNKYVSVLSSLNNAKEHLSDDIKIRLNESRAKGYNKLFLEHTKEWEKIWATSDVVIEGDIFGSTGNTLQYFPSQSDLYRKR